MLNKQKLNTKKEKDDYYNPKCTSKSGKIICNFLQFASCCMYVQRRTQKKGTSTHVLFIIIYVAISGVARNSNNQKQSFFLHSVDSHLSLDRLYSPTMVDILTKLNSRKETLCSTATQEKSQLLLFLLNQAIPK